MKPLVNSAMNAARAVRDVRRWRPLCVPVRDCVNFNGFLYRRESFHPLHRYLFDLESKGLIAARRALVEFFRFYRPADAAQALGIAPLDKPQPLFMMPWDRFLPHDYDMARCHRFSPMDCSDIFTRYNERGLVSYLIEEEWGWTERALHSLRNYGYQPETRGYLEVRAFVRENGERRYLLIDGNHRASAMCFLGWERIEVICDTLREVRERDADKWWGVRKGYYSCEAALALFHAYFPGNSQVITTDQAAPIEAPQEWLQLYGAPRSLSVV